MALAFEQDTAPDAIEATLAYIVDDGTKVFTETGGAGATDRRYGGTTRALPISSTRTR